MSCAFSISYQASTIHSASHKVSLFSSVLNKTPANLLTEIIMVDDFSDNRKFLHQSLSILVKFQFNKLMINYL